MTPEQIIDMILTIAMWFIGLGLAMTGIGAAFFAWLERSQEAHERGGEGGE